MKKRKVLNRGRSRTSLSSLSRDPKVQNILKNLNLDSDDEDSYALNPDATIFKPLQENLHQQLSKNYDSVDVNVVEFKNRKKKLKEDLEDVGFNLYNFQKRLANLHLKIRIASNAYEKNYEIRKEKEDKLITKQAEFEIKSNEYSNLIHKYEQLREELENLNNSIREIEEKNQNKLSDLVVMKRMAYKAEQDVKQKEITKQDQDFYINNLMEKMSNIKEKIEKIESQIRAQKEETKKAQLAVYQASFEDSRLNFEREQLLKDWDSAVIGVKFRILTLERIQKAAEVQENEIRALNNEIQKIKADQQEQKQITESRMRVLKRMEDRIQSISDKILEIQKQKKKLADQTQSFMNQIALKQNQFSNLFDERNNVKKEYEQNLANVNVLSNQVRASEEMMENRSRHHSQHEREIANLQRALGPLNRKIDAKKKEIIDLQNEKVRSNFVKLTLDNQCAIYQERLTGIKKGILENEQLMTNLENKSKENKKQIELNLKMIEKLNKKQESNKPNPNDDDFYPLESKLHEFQLKVQGLSEEGIKKQNEWIKLQTEFVQISQSSESLNKENNQALSKVNVLQRKVERTKIQLDEIQKENQKYQIHVKVSQNELDRLNKQMISVSKSNSNADTQNFDSNLIDLLQAKEKEAADIENKIEINFQSRKEIAEEQIDTERMIEVWLKRIKMVEDLEKSFDRSKNEQELQMMKNEVRRLEESLDKIRSQQRKIVQQMQFALRRRETVKPPDYEKNSQMINEGIKRLKEMKETKDEDSILSESLARLQMMKDEPDLEAKAENDDEENNIDNDQNQQNLLNELEIIENEIYKNEKIIEEESNAKFEMQLELSEIQEVLNEFQRQQVGFQQMIHDETRLNRNLQAKFSRMQQRTKLLNGTKFKNDPDLQTKFENVQKQIIDLTMFLDGLCFEFPDLADKFHSIQDILSFD